MCPPLALHLASPWPRRREPQCHCRDKVNNVFACRWCIRARAPGAGWLCCVLRHGQYPPREATGGRDAPRGYDLLFVAAAGGCTLALVLKLVLGRQTISALCQYSSHGPHSTINMVLVAVLLYTYGLLL